MNGAVIASQAPPQPILEARSVGRLENVAFLSVVTTLLFSMWGPAILRINGFYMPELLAPPITIYLLKRHPHIIRSIWRCIFSPAGVAATLWISLVAAIGVWLRGSFVGPYSEWRASLLLVYSFLLMYAQRGERGHVWATRLMWISFGALSADALLAALGILRPGFLGQPIPDAEEVALFGLGRITVPAINIVAVAYLAARGRRIGLIAATLALGGVLSLGGHRILLAATLVSALFLPIAMVGVFRARRMRARWLRVAVAPLVVVAMVAAFRSSTIQDYLDRATGIQNRLFNHTIETLAGIQSGLTGSGRIEYGDETIRAAYAAYVLTQWPSLLLPHGLGSREVEGRLGPEFDEVGSRWQVPSKNAHTHDNAVLYAAYHHGLLATGVLMLVLCSLLLHRLRSERGLDAQTQILVAVAGVALIDMIYPPVPGINVAGIYGLFLGTLLNPAALRPLPPTPRVPRRLVGGHSGPAGAAGERA